MLSKIRKANLFVMLAFLFGVLVPAGWIVALPTASARAPALKPPLDINGFECDFGLQHQVTTIQSRTSPNTETVTIGDQVWFDANENGIQDAFPDSRSEEGRRVPRTGIGGVVCVLCQQGKAAPVASTLSNAKGHYSFTLHLSESATYYIVVEPPEEYVFTIKDANNNQNDVVDSDVDPQTGRTDFFTLQPGQPNHTLDVGLIDAPPPQVTMALSPSQMTTGVGQSFEISIEVQPNSVDQVIEVAQAYLNFDSNFLQLNYITQGRDLPTVLGNSFDNDAGYIDFAASKPAPPFPTDTFTLATMSFTTLASTTGTYITFNHEEPRQSDVTFANRSILSTTMGNLVKVMIPTAVDSVSLNSGTAQSSSPWGGWLALVTLGVIIWGGWRRVRA